MAKGGQFVTIRLQKEDAPLLNFLVCTFSNHVCTFSKVHGKRHFFAKKFGHVKKKQYLCIRNRKLTRIDILHPAKRKRQRWGATAEG